MMSITCVHVYVSCPVIPQHSLVLGYNVDSKVRFEAARNHTKEGGVNVTLPRTTSPLCCHVNTQ
jgi:hypothetical protein